MELLIVIVVIAILAAITVVAYNGVQDRARASAASSAASQARKKVEFYRAENDAYPLTLAATGLSDSGSASYQYSVNTNTGTYCITATTSNVSYYVNNSTTTSPTPGGCAGHGQGGVAAITNLVFNPSTDGSSGWNTGGAVLASSYVSGFDGATRAFRATRTGTGAAVILGELDSSVVGNAPYSFRISLRSSAAITANVQLRGSPSSAHASASTSIGLQPGQVHTVSASVTSWNGGHTDPKIAVAWSDGAAGAWLEVTKAFVTTGNSFTGNYADGNSPNWTWNGTPNASTSTGPPL